MDINMLLHPDDNTNKANEFSSSLGSVSLLMREEEEEMQDEALLLNEGQPFELTLVQLKMVSDNKHG
jgi:hypothetical protein